MGMISAARKRPTLDFARFRRFSDDFERFGTILKQTLDKQSLWRALESIERDFRNAKPVQCHLKISYESNCTRIKYFPGCASGFCSAETTYTGFPARFRRFLYVWEGRVGDLISSENRQHLSFGERNHLFHTTTACTTHLAAFVVRNRSRCLPQTSSCLGEGH